MSDNLNLIRVDDAHTDLGNRVPRGSILYQEDKRIYYIALRATVPGDTIDGMLAAGGITNFDKFLGVYPSEMALRTAVPLGSYGAYAYVIDNQQPTAPLSFYAWNSATQAWENASSGGKTAAAHAFKSGTEYKKGDLIVDGVTLYMAALDFTSQNTIAQDIQAGNFIPVGSSPTTVKEWRTGVQYNIGDLIYDPNGTGLFVATADFTSQPLINDDKNAGFLAPAVPVHPPFSPTTYKDLATMLASSTHLEEGQFAVVENPNDPTESGVYFVETAPPRIVDDFNFLAYTSELPNRGALNAVNGLVGIDYTGPPVPQLKDLKWYDARQLVMLVPDEPARLALQYPEDVNVGSLCVQQDVGEVFIRTNVGWNSIADAIGTGVIAVADEAARFGLAAGDVTAGILVYQEDTKILWEYTGVIPATTASVSDAKSWTRITMLGETPKVIEVQNFNALPAPAQAGSDDTHPLYLIREDAKGDPLNQVVWWADTTPAPTQQVPNPPKTGTWIIAASSNFLKMLQANPDVSGNLRIGDLQGTIEPNHAELKMYDGGSWQMLFSEDEIRSWIAAGSLFQGTVMNAPAAGGALTLADLPIPSSANKGFYWSWVGSAGYTVEDGTTYQGTTGYQAVTVAVAPQAPAAGNPVTITFDSGGAAAGVARPLYMSLSTTGGPNEGSQQLIYNIQAGDDAAAIAAGIVAAWNNGDIDIDMTAAAGVLTLTPTAGSNAVISVDDVFADGQAPVIGEDLGGDTIQVGDWLQIVPDPSGTGYRWAHVPSDLLSKIRGDQLYSIQEWADGNWEVNSVVTYDGRLWRAQRKIGAGDPSPARPGIPRTIRGQNPVDGFFSTDADVNAWLAQAVSTQRTGKFIVLDSGITSGGPFNLPGGGTLAADVGDAIICLGDSSLGTEGYIVVGGPFNVVVTPAHTVRASGPTTTTNTNGALPVPGETIYQRMVSGGVPVGQRIIATHGFTIPTGLPFAGKTVHVGDTFWFTGDISHGERGWEYIAAVTQPAGQPEIPPVVLDKTAYSIGIRQSGLPSELQLLLNNIANLNDGDVYTISAAGSLPVDATNSVAGTALNVGDYITITHAQAGEFSVSSGPYVQGTQTINWDGTFVRGFGSSFNDPTLDDIADILNGQRPFPVGDVYGYAGSNTIAKDIPVAWPEAGNLAGTSLPNRQGVFYLIGQPVKGHFVVQPATPSWRYPVRGDTVTYNNVQVPMPPPTDDVSAAPDQAILWPDLMNDPVGAVSVHNGANIRLHVGMILDVEEAPAAGLAGLNSAGIAGTLPQPGDQIYLVSENPATWVLAPGPAGADAGLFEEGNIVADPATLTYNSPEIITAQPPLPQATVPGIAIGQMPWKEIPAEGNLHSVANDLQLPVGGDEQDQLYFVMSSAMNNGDPAIYAWDGVKWENVGGTSGHGLQPPQAPDNLHTNSLRFNPGVGIEWHDDRGGVIVVADEAARLALRNPADIDQGSIVVQKDTGWTWRYDPAYVGDPFWSPWRVFSDYVGADTIAYRDVLTPHLHIDSLCSVDGVIYQYVENPNAGQAGEDPGMWVEMFAPVKDIVTVDTTAGNNPTTGPTEGKAGDVFYNEEDKAYWVHSGQGWQRIQTGTPIRRIVETPNAPDEVEWSITGASWSNFPPGEPLIIQHVENNQIPASAWGWLGDGVPAKEGDWLIGLDNDGNDISDQFVIHRWDETDDIQTAMHELAIQVARLNIVIGSLNPPEPTTVFYDKDYYPMRRAYTPYGHTNVKFYQDEVGLAYLFWFDDGTWGVLIRSDIQVNASTNHIHLKFRGHASYHMWNSTTGNGLTSVDNMVASLPYTDADSDFFMIKNEFGKNDPRVQKFNEKVFDGIAKMKAPAIKDSITAFSAQQICGAYTYAYFYRGPKSELASSGGWLGHTSYHSIKLIASNDDFYVGVEAQAAAATGAKDLGGINEEAYLQADLATLQGASILGVPITAWPVDQFITLADGNNVHWTGVDWAAGVGDGVAPTDLGPVNSQATAQADLATLQAANVDGIPATAWTTGQFIALGDSSNAYWDGSAWVAGTAP